MEILYLINTKISPKSPTQETSIIFRSAFTRVNYCYAKCNVTDRRALYQRDRTNQLYHKMLDSKGAPEKSLTTRCTKSTWDSEKTENWVPNDIECISTCPPVVAFDLDPELSREDNCAHSKGIEFSTGTSCDPTCSEGFRVSVTSISCQDSGDWTVSPDQIECHKIQGFERNAFGSISGRQFLNIPGFFWGIEF